MVQSRPHDVAGERSPLAGDLPPIDDRLVVPGTRREMYDGELVKVPPADPPHAARHAQVVVLLQTHAHRDYEVAADMLVRTSKRSDIAPDVVVSRRGPDPVTGRQRVPELALEIANSQRLSQATKKATMLAERGVRRVVVIELARARLLEWSGELAALQPLADDGQLEDAVLGAPLPIAELIHAAETDDTVARALVHKKNPVFEAEVERGRLEGRAEGRAEGRLEGRAEGIAASVLAILTARGFRLEDADRTRILGQRDVTRLAVWLVRLSRGASVLEMFQEVDDSAP
jgi:hypothetical protein